VIAICPTLKDSFVVDAFPDANYGSDTYISIYEGLLPGDKQRGVVYFDLSSIKSGSIINSSTLTFPNNSNDGDVTVDFIPIIKDWEEMTVTWNSPWTSPGIDYNSPNKVTALIKAWPDITVIDVTSLLKYWIEQGHNNYGIAIIGFTNDHEVSFLSKDSGSGPEVQLKLEVNYTEQNNQRGGVNMKTRVELTLGGGDIIIYPGTVNEANLGYVKECAFVPEKEIAWFLANVPQTEVEGIPIRISFGLRFKWHQINSKNMAIALGVSESLIDKTTYADKDIVPLGLNSDIPKMPYRFVHTRRDGKQIIIDIYSGMVGAPSEMGFPETEFFGAETAIKALAVEGAETNYEYGQIILPRSEEVS